MKRESKAKTPRAAVATRGVKEDDFKPAADQRQEAGALKKLSMKTMKSLLS